MNFDMETLQKMLSEIVEFFKQVVAEIEKIFGIDLDGSDDETTTV